MLHHAQFDFQNLLQVFAAQRLEDHHFVDAVHELGREFAARRIHRRAIDLVVERFVDLDNLRSKTESAIDQVRHLSGAQIRRHDDDALRQSPRAGCHPA